MSSYYSQCSTKVLESKYSQLVGRENMQCGPSQGPSCYEFVITNTDPVFITLMLCLFRISFNHLLLSLTLTLILTMML